MIRKVSVLVVGVLLAAAPVLASSAADPKNMQLFNEVSKSITRYPNFTIFDDVNANVKDGVVTLTGKVTMPYKKDEITKRVLRVDGVLRVLI